MTGVLVVGGGLAGLGTAAFLSRHGVDCVLVERHDAVSPHPRARGINPRTMELMRSLGLEEEIRSTPSAVALAGNQGVIAAESLAGAEYGALREDYFQDGGTDLSALSPTSWCLCHQDEYEPILRQFAERHGADVRFGTELVSFRSASEGVRATLRDRDGAEQEIETTFLVAADGPRSEVRKRLGIGFAGTGTLAHYLNVHFAADLREPLGDRRFVMAYCFSASFRGALMPIDNATRWLLHVPFDPATESVADFDRDRCRELVRAAAGVPDLEVEVLKVLPWEAAGRTADRFCGGADGNVFLVGDSAHVMPPSGAFGANIALHDAHNLAWKIASVLDGSADRALLDSYDAERRPIGAATVEQAVLRSRDRPRLVAEEAPPPDPAIVRDSTVWFGAHYGADGPWTEDPHALPGTRAPHLPLVRAGRTVSTLDLYQGAFTLVAGPRGEAWPRAAERLPVTTHLVGRDILDTTGGWAEAHGVRPDGAVLVRPDGFVAWRAEETVAEPEKVLESALARATFRERTR